MILSLIGWLGFDKLITIQNNHLVKFVINFN